MNEISTWQDFFEAVKRMRTLQQTPCLTSEKTKAEQVVDKAIFQRENRSASNIQHSLFNQDSISAVETSIRNKYRRSK